MKQRILLPMLIGLILTLILPVNANADGMIIPVPPPDVDPVTIPNLAIKYHRVEVTIDHQVATTRIDQVFVNDLPYDVEGTYIFPVPKGASVTEFAMWVDGERLSAQLLSADEAQRIYERIVRQRRDPAILEYIGNNAFRVRIFPIPAHGEKRIQLEYSQILESDRGLVKYVYPLGTEKFSSRPLDEVTVHLSIRSEEPIKSVYCASHDAFISREDDYSAEVSYEEQNVTPDRDFELYYTISEEDFGLNLLSYRPKGEDGFFLLLISPKMEVNVEEVVAKDVIFVLDTSGSMRGDKLAQAKQALEFVLDNLHEEDRFNIIAFSTGLRQYAPEPVPAEERNEAKRFVRDLRAVGGTNIDRALREALRQARGERPQIIIFLTDGLATEGITDTAQIIRSVNEKAPDTVRIFTFGVGYQVNTILLDTIAQGHRGASAYVQPGQSIEAEVSAFYAKVSTPLLADIILDFGRIHAEEIYPYPLPDIFAGSQLVLVGRYRRGGNTDVVMRGKLEDEEHTFRYKDIHFRDEGGSSFIAPLWATRKVGYLLNQIRLHGEDRELIEEVVDLSIRYGIVTPYTSFLVDETEEALTSKGRSQIVREQVEMAVRAATAPAYGAAAVQKSVAQESLRQADTAVHPRHEAVKQVKDKAFVRRDGVWTDTTFDPSTMKAKQIVFGSDAYFQILSEHPDWGVYFALGPKVIVVLDGRAYEIIEESQGEHAPSPSPNVNPEPIYPEYLWERVWHWFRGVLD